MSWQAVAFPVRISNHTLALAEDLKLYATSGVELGGNFRLVICDLSVSPPTCSSLDTGVPVPSTDGHFNLRDILVEGDYIYACYARWSGLVCYRFSRITGAGSSYGSVNPAGHSDLNYHHMVKIKEDEWYMKARVGNGLQWALFRFKGSPSQITDATQWERIGYIIDDTPISAGSCGDGAIPYSYCSYWFHVNERYLVFHCFTRCPANTAETGNFSVFIFDTIKERLLAPDFSSEVGFGGHSLNPATKITIVSGKPTGTIYRGETQFQVIDMNMTRKKIYGHMGWSLPGGFTMGLIDVDLNSRTAKYIDRTTTYWPYPNALTTDGKVIITEPGNIRLYDPATESITDVLSISGLQSWYAQACLNTEDVFRHVETIIITSTHLILPPNWQDGLKIPKRITVSSPAPNQLRVQAQFQLAPAQVRVRLWKIPDLTSVNEETLTGSTSIDRTYSVTAGRYRAEVTAL